MDQDELQKAYDSLKRIHDSLSNVVKKLEKELEDTKEKIRILEAEKNQWEIAKVMQGVIIQQSLDGQNKLYQDQVAIIQELKNRLRKYEDG